MNLTDNARNLLRSLGATHGIESLDFGLDDTIPIVLEGLQMALTYRASEDAFVLFGVVDLAPEFDRPTAWSIFEANSDLSTKATRLAMDPASGALFLICEMSCSGLSDVQLSERMDAFVQLLSERVASLVPMTA